MVLMTENKVVPKLRFGEFNDSWEKKKLGDVGKVKMCKRIFSSQTTEKGDIPFYKIGTFGKKADAFIDIDLYNEFKHKYSYPKVGEILMSASGTLGRTVVFDGSPSYYQDSNIVWLANNEELITNNFLFYVYQIVRYDSEGGTIQRLYNSIISNTKFYKPSLPEQQKIASFLSAVDTKLQQLTKKKSLLEAYKKGVLQKIFSQALRFKDEFGNNFPDWEEKKLGDIFEIESGKSKSKYITEHGENIIVDMGGISRAPSLVANKRTNYNDDFLNTNDLVMPKDDIGGGLIIGKVVEIPENDKYIFGDHIYRLTYNKGYLIYLKYAINSYGVNKSFRQKANGTAQLSLNRKVVETQHIQFPILEEQQKIANFLSAIDKKIELVNTQIENTKVFKKGLLQQMFV